MCPPGGASELKPSVRNKMFDPWQKKTVDTWFFGWYYLNILCWRRRFLSRKFFCQVAPTRCCRSVRSPPSTSCFCSSAGALRNISDTSGQTDSDVEQTPWTLLVSQSNLLHPTPPQSRRYLPSTEERGTRDTSHPQPAADDRQRCHGVSTLAHINIR